MKNIIILASGSGTNAENIHNFVSQQNGAKVSWILTNNPNAYVLERAKRLSINTLTFTKKGFSEDDTVLEFLKKQSPDLIVLAGFLLLIPPKIVEAFPNKIINIHPALLPKFGGKGMFGDHVHKAVIQNKEKESGITIHYVNEKYDEGAPIFQAKCTLSEGETAETLAQKVHQLEYEHFPRIITEILLNQ